MQSENTKLAEYEEEQIDGEFGLVEVVTPKLAYLISEIPYEIVSSPESELIDNGRIDQTDWKLRIKFWHEFRTISDPNLRGTRVPKMKLTNIFGDVCDKTVWSNRVANPYKLSFIIRPINDFEEETELVLQIAAKRLWDIITMDITGKDGKVDAKRGQLLLNAITLAADRARGLAIIRSQSLNLNVNGDNKDLSKSQNQISDIKELDHKIKELTARLNGSSSPSIEGEIIG